MLWDGREVARRRAELGAIGAALIRSDPGKKWKDREWRDSFELNHHRNWVHGRDLSRIDSIDYRRLAIFLEYPFLSMGSWVRIDPGFSVL